MHHRRSPSPSPAANRLRFESLESRQVLSGVADLLLDVNAVPIGTTGSAPLAYVANGDHVLFTTTNSAVAELWRTDGSEAGTTRLRTFQPGGLALTNVNGVFYFTASESSSNFELWRTDGSAAGTWLVKDIRAVGASAPTALVNVNGTLYFRATDDATGTELWKSDGTAEGTVIARDVLPGTTSSQAVPQFNLNGSLVFTARDAGGNYSLFLDGGSASPPTLLKTFGSTSSNGPFANFTQAGPALYFTANQGLDGVELWKTDGTAAGTIRVADVDPSGNDSLSRLTNVNGTLFFVADRTTLEGAELWKSDGTAAGTVLVKDIRSGIAASDPKYLFNYGGVLYFAADDGVNGNELWRSDGTAAGTVLVEDVNVGSAASNPTEFANINGTLYFNATTASAGAEFRKLDGGSVALVRDILPGVGPSWASRFTNFNGQILFTATGSNAVGAEPWISDGTAAGTRIVKDIRISTDSSNPSTTVEVNGIHYFIANDGVRGNELWRTDGTSAGTYLVKDILPGAGSAFPVSLTIDLVNVNGKLYFAANDGASGIELWTSDGTAAGTTLVADANPGASSTFPRLFTNVGGVLYYAANDASGAELWRSNGTAVGTMRAADLNPGAPSSLLDQFVVAAGTLYFTAVTPTTGRELWKLAPGASTPVQVTNFAAATIETTVARLTVVGDKVFFVMRDDLAGDELWVADSAGARRVIDLQPTGLSGAPTSMVNVNGTLFFTPLTSDHGRELWRSNGTPAGTFEILDIVPGSNGSSPLNLVNVSGTLFFSAATPANGIELWKSDGTAAGTLLAADIVPGSPGSVPLSPFQTPQYVVIGEWLYFVARTQLSNSGILYRISNASTSAELLTDAYSLSSRQTRNLINLNGELAFVGGELDGIGPGVEMYVLRSAAIAQAGDYTSDGVVDGADFLAWQRSFNTRVEPYGSGADGSGNGIVNSFDLDVWKGNFGEQTSPAVVAASELAAVATPPAANSLTVLDAAFASTDGPVAPLGAAALTLHDQTAVNSPARPSRPPRHHASVASPTLSTVPPRPQSIHRTASLQRPVGAKTDLALPAAPADEPEPLQAAFNSPLTGD
ncbi:ELWxxDGT repeat protein [Lacipirellula sp.]|uniref:ELWxxDGT repeat protein n=1 Tax=Lacipirellula sp. TaxID=2691419 RepID=UPI003D0ED921